MRIFRNFYAQCAEEVSRCSLYYDELVLIDEPQCDNDYLFSQIRARKKRRLERIEDLTPSTDPDHRCLVLLCGNLNYSLDIEGLFRQLESRISRGGRIMVLAFSPYYSGAFDWAHRLGLVRHRGMKTFVTEDSLLSLAALSGLQVVRSRPLGMIPFRWLGVGDRLSRILSASPGLRFFCPATLLTLRPLKKDAGAKPSLSIVVPARNEEGNIRNLIPRLPPMEGVDVEIVFVEGNSTDRTWDAIEEVRRNHAGPYRIQTLKQTGKGKNNAVREGFDAATGDLLVILDADLTMPPEMLPRFYEAYGNGHADFINGSRLVYPMEGGAMRFLNRLGNVFFVKALNFCLENRISDTLCGTKLIRRSDYRRLKEWRRDFGDFDPFGDFELVFFASLGALGIVDIPVYYRARTYGETNIRRFRDGFVLLMMTVIAFLRIRV